MDNSHRSSSTTLFIAISYVEGTYPPSTSFIAFIIFPKRTGGFHQVASHLSVIFPPNDRSCFAARGFGVPGRPPSMNVSRETFMLIRRGRPGGVPMFHVKHRQ